MNLQNIYRLLEELKTKDRNHIKSINPALNILDAFSRIIGQSVYIMDYEKRDFAYVSSNPLFLCGYTAEDVLQMGYSFYTKVVVEEDIQILIEIEDKEHDLFCRLPIETRMKSIISFDYRMKSPGNKILMVNKKNTPLFLTEEGSVRFALCIVSLSTYNHPGNVMIRIDDTLSHYVYSFETKKWKKVTGITLSKREKDVLQLAARGCSNEEIAQSLFINVSTVKFHKTNIYNKLNVKNINKAIAFAYNNLLL